MAGFGRIMIGASMAVALGTVALRAQTQLEDPRNASKIFANNCVACHKTPQGLKNGASVSFLRQHYTTGPEMSAAMASYLASVGGGPAPKKNNEKTKEATAPATKAAPAKREQAARAPEGPETPATTPAARAKAQKNAKSHAEPVLPPPRPPESVIATTPESPLPSGPAPSSAPAPTSAPTSTTSAALSTPPQAPASEPTPAVSPNMGIPLPEFPSEPPPDLSAQPPVFSSAPLP